MSRRSRRSPTNARPTWTTSLDELTAAGGAGRGRRRRGEEPRRRSREPVAGGARRRGAGEGARGALRPPGRGQPGGHVAHRLLYRPLPRALHRRAPARRSVTSRSSARSCERPTCRRISPTCRWWRARSTPRARSRAKAQGMWQFMAGTAKLYDLRCDGLVDERNDPYLATQAAVRHLVGPLRHLRLLGARPGGLQLAAPARSSGRSQRAKGNTDFWTVRRYLRRETRNYVPALWAVVVVTKNPAAYGLPPIEENPVVPRPRPGRRRARPRRARGARPASTPRTLAEINPALTRRLTRRGEPTSSRCRAAASEQVAEVIASIPPTERVRRFLHVVQAGRHPGRDRAPLRLDGGRDHGGQRDPQPARAAHRSDSGRAARSGRSARREPARDRPRPAEKVATAMPNRYVVRHGDTLYSIARRFGTSTEEIQTSQRPAGHDDPARRRPAPHPLTATQAQGRQVREAGGSSAADAVPRVFQALRTCCLLPVACF